MSCTAVYIHSVQDIVSCRNCRSTFQKTSTREKWNQEMRDSAEMLNPKILWRDLNIFYTWECVCFVFVSTPKFHFQNYPFQDHFKPMFSKFKIMRVPNQQSIRQHQNHAWIMFSKFEFHPSMRNNLNKFYLHTFHIFNTRIATYTKKIKLFLVCYHNVENSS